MVWHESLARCKSDRVVVKLVNEDGSFRQSVIVPTAYYPLNGSMKVFTSKNTKPVEDKKVLEIFDAVKYHIGHCYSNTESLLSLLLQNGYDAKAYCGWLFTNNWQTPIHHAWVVLDDTSVLDLGDDFTVMLGGTNGEKFEGKDIEEARELIADFHVAAMNVPNSVRCSPVGTPTSFLLYVGSECDPQTGRMLYNNLMGKYPNHECQRNCNSFGLNATQSVMYKRGLMS